MWELVNEKAAYQDTSYICQPYHCSPIRTLPGLSAYLPCSTTSYPEPQSSPIWSPLGLSHFTLHLFTLSQTLFTLNFTFISIISQYTLNYNQLSDFICPYFYFCTTVWTESSPQVMFTLDHLQNNSNRSHQDCTICSHSYLIYVYIIHNQTWSVHRDTLVYIGSLVNGKVPQSNISVFPVAVTSEASQVLYTWGKLDTLVLL